MEPSAGEHPPVLWVLKASGHMQEEVLFPSMQRPREPHCSGRSQSLAGASQTVGSVARAAVGE
jgi:hypothetical protein